MLNIKNYVRAQSLDEAYELCQKRRNVVLGGMLWLKMGNRNVQTAIDLCDLGLDQIEEDEENYKIGAMVSLRALEVHQGLNELTKGAMANSVESIVGVQFRNVATVGGSLYGRFGFSDVLTLFQVLDAKIELHHHGVMSVTEFAVMSRHEKDILVRVIVPKTPKKVAYQSMRNTKTDFPVLACAVSEINGKYTCAVGARPMKAEVYFDEKEILKDGITEESAKAFAEDVANRAGFGSNVRGSAEYRQKLCAVLVRRALLQMKEV